MSNRVEELESTVAELRAAVDGLTEELVETRERLRQLEENERASEETRTVESAHAERVDATPEPEPEAESEAEESGEQKTDADATDTEDEDAAEDDEIIVA
jgi:uncharacterized coiled-coil protein SlyX